MDAHKHVFGRHHYDHDSLQRVAIRICAPVPRRAYCSVGRREILPLFVPSGRKEILAFRVSPANISPNQMKRELTQNRPPKSTLKKAVLHSSTPRFWGQPSERNSYSLRIKRIETLVCFVDLPAGASSRLARQNE